jgi:DNA-cytosine methyltransferase
MFTLGTDCSGIDAVHAALTMLGDLPSRYVFASDIKPACRAVLRNLSPAPETVYHDILTREMPPPVDLYVAGFPCQSFSLLNVHNTPEQMAKGFDVMNAAVHYIETTQPRMFVLENVRNFAKHYIDRLLDGHFEGYNVEWRVMSPHKYGHPQSRARLFVVGTRTPGGGIGWPSPSAVTNPALPEIVLDRDKAEQIQPKVFRRLKPGSSTERFVRERCTLTPERAVVDLNMAHYALGQPTHRRLHERYAPCLTTRSVFLYVPAQRRFLTLWEAFRIQGFPFDFDKDHPGVASTGAWYQMVGNSMCVPLVAQLLAANQHLYHAPSN